MSLSKRLGMWLGGAMLFFGLLAFITFFAMNTSGVMTPQYFNSSIQQIISAYNSANNIYGTLNASQLSTLSSLINQNPNCNVLCYVSSQLGVGSNITPFITTYSLSLYQLIIEIVVALGAVIIFFSYPDIKSKLTALGRLPLSAAIISFVSTYVPLTYIIPYFFSGFKVSSFTIRIPASVFAPFTKVVLSLDIIIGIIGAVLLIVAAVVSRVGKRSNHKTLPPTQLQVKKDNK